MATTTIIDRLITTLELDTRKFDEGMKKSLESLKEFSKEAKEVSLGAKKHLGDGVERAAGQGRMGLYALIAAAYAANRAFGFPAIQKFVQGVVDSETETFRFAKSLKLNAQDLQAWGKTVQTHGGDIRAFNASLEKMEANFGKIGSKVRGAKILEQYLGLAGLKGTEVAGKGAFAVLEEFANKMQTMSVERQFLVGKRLGLDEATIRTLQEGGPAILQQVAAMRELAATNEELKNAKDVAVAQAEANIQWERAKQVLATAFLPVLKAAADGLKRFSEFAKQNKEIVVAALIVMGTALALFAGVAAIASAKILISGIEIATGMTFATGGGWAAGVGVGLAALAGLTAAVGVTAGAMAQFHDASERVNETISTGNDKMDAAIEKTKTLNRWLKEGATALNSMREAREKLGAEREASLGRIEEDRKAKANAQAGGYITGYLYSNLSKLWAHNEEAKEIKTIDQKLQAISNAQVTLTDRIVAAQQGIRRGTPAGFLNTPGETKIQTGDLHFHIGEGRDLNIDMNGQFIGATSGGKTHQFPVHP